MAVSVVFSTLKKLKALLAAGSLGFLSATPSAPSASTPSSLAVEEDLQRLGRTLERIQAVLADAEERQITDEQVRLWLWEIGELAHDAQDVLDEVEFVELQARVDQARWGKGREQPAAGAGATSSRGPLNDPSFREELLKRIGGIRARSDKIEADRDGLRLGEEEAPRRASRAPPRPPAAARVDRSCTFGRDGDVDDVVGMLDHDDGDDEDDPISVVAIHGVDGIGKTTLAQLVFEDERVENQFDVKLWVWASPDFDVTRLTREILESATGESWDLDELSSLQEILDQHLTGKKVLLVLDDVWNEIQSYWDALLVSLHSAANGSRVIVTTPSVKVARASGSPPSQHHQLQQLADEASWSLFCHYAFGGDLAQTRPRIVEMGKEICRGCGGFPLTLRTTAELLRGQTDERWREEISLAGDVEDDGGGGKTLSALRVGYHHLPAHLKQCFAYCAVLPARARKFRKDQLVRLWIAQGFVGPTERKQEEEVAGEYFDDLHRRSFFQQKSDHGSTTTTRMFLMHDPVRNLAQSVWEENCSSRGEEPPGCKISRHHCHSTVVCDKLAALSAPCDASYDPSALRTLILRCGGDPNDTLRSPSLLDALLQKLCYLRVLDLSDNDVISELPPSVGDLRFLRYLGLNKTKITRLPEEISGLCCLQTLELRHCYRLAELPTSTKYLLSLRHLDLHCSINLQKMPCGIGDLTGIQTLPLFAVGKEEGYAADEESRPAGIVELGCLNGLRGELHILGLQNAVYGKTDAGRAKMSEKEHLEKLHLDWEGEDSTDPELTAVRHQDLLESLQPHANIRELKISLYKGRSFPSWMGSGAFGKLRKVTLVGCGQCGGGVSPLGQLPALRSLDVRKMDGIRRVGREFFCRGEAAAEELFPSLEELGLHSMAEWEEWLCWDEEGGGDFPRLRRLTVRSCPKLTSLSLYNLKALRALDVRNCEELAWISCFEDCGPSGGLQLQGGGRQPCLEKMEFQGCPKLGIPAREQPSSAPHRLHAGSCTLQRKRTHAEASDAQRGLP